MLVKKLMQTRNEEERKRRGIHARTSRNSNCEAFDEDRYETITVAQPINVKSLEEELSRREDTNSRDEATIRKILDATVNGELMQVYRRKKSKKKGRWYATGTQLQSTKKEIRAAATKERGISIDLIGQ